MHVNYVRRIEDSLRKEENFLEIKIISLIFIIPCVTEWAICLIGISVAAF